MYKLLTLFLGLALLTSCQSESSKSGQKDDQVNSVPPPALAVLFAPNTKVFRGIDFKTNRKALLKTETAEKVELADPNAETFSVDLNDIEFADIRYVLKEDAVNSIELDLFAADVNSARAYFDMLEAHFNKDYQVNGGMWTGQRGDVSFSAILSLIDDEDNPGVSVLWEQTQ